MNLQPIHDRLAAVQVDGRPLFQKVLTALDPETVIQGGIVRADSAFIVPMREEADPNQRTTGTFSQPMTVTFGVMIGVRAINDRLGSNINDRLEAATKATRQALIGWEPNPDHDPITFTAGEIIAFLQGGAFWMEQYQTGFIYEQE